MLPNMPRPTWLDTVNEAATRVARRVGGAKTVLLRRDLVREIARTYPFPLRMVFRGYVVGARTLEAPVLAETRGASPSLRTRKVQKFLEVVPEGIVREAFETLGPVLVPCDRDLGEGSVVTVAVDISDPSTYHLDAPGMLADVAHMEIEVGVER